MAASLLGGDIRSINPSRFVRVLRIASGLELLSSCLRHLSRLLLRIERRGELSLEGTLLHIREQRSVLGRPLAERRTVLPVDQVVSISLFDRRAELWQTVGLGALAAGTLLGAGFFAEGLRVPGLAPSLLGFGLLLAAIGGLVDFALDRAAQRAVGTAVSSLRIVPTRGAGILLSGVPPALAAAWLDEARTCLAAREPTSPPDVDQT